MTNPIPLKKTLLFALLCLCSATVLAEPGERGSILHDENCMRCHDTSVYTREGRMVESLVGLESQVRRCETNLELKWFDDDIRDVAFYLNHHFYQFQN